ncbi:MAG: hypothetical protein IPH59_10330 [bacterium]|nr:hypothetical protein [bacterium]
MAMYDIEAVKQADVNNIVKVAKDIGLDVKNNRARCFCPQNHQHGDRTPSLSFDQRSNSFRCWVCKDVHGDVIDLVMMVLGLSFPDALKFLADRAGIQPTNQPVPKKQRVIANTMVSRGAFRNLQMSIKRLTVCRRI